MDRSKYTKFPIDYIDTDEVSMLSLFDKNNPDRNLLNLVDDELIKLAGSEILLYKYLKSDEHDDVYSESRKKPISREPIKIYGSYDPRPIEENLTQFGVEITNDQTFVFNRKYLERKVGRSLISGDILKPVFQDLKFEIYQVQEDSFESYGVYHVVAYGRLLRDNMDSHNDTFDINDIQGGKL